MLRKTIKELGLHSIIYSLGGFASVIASIILLPIYTRFLSRTDYGIIEVIDTIRAQLIVILLAGFVPAMAKFYNEANSEDKKRDVVGTSFWFIVVSGLVWIALLFLFDNALAEQFLTSAKFVVYIDLGIILLFIQAFLTTGESYLNIRKKSQLFLIASLSRLGLNIAANLYFIIVLRLQARGMLYGELLSSVIVGIVLVGYLAKTNGLRFRSRLLVNMLKFGLPFIPTTFSATLMHKADRLLLPRFTSLQDVGVYGLGYRFPFMLNSLLLDSFGRIWYASVMYEIAAQKDYQKIYAKVTTYFVTVYVVAQYLLIIMAPTIVRILAAPEYFQAWKVVQVIGIGMCFYSFHNFFVTGAFIKNKTWYLPVSHILAACINIALNWYLLPRYGYMAAAWNTVITYLVFSILNFFLFRKVYPIPFEFGRLGFLLGIGIGLVLINNALFLQNSILEFFKELVFSTILPLLLVFGPYLEHDEKESLAEELKKIHPALASFYTRLQQKSWIKKK
ncbi:polysaccharide biosynthesis protein [Candidatus Vecturithrix granuli]|uniref:Polysaccharide biosynthesis protein n=1 Tax=Vecturithrix granuli TaxID=1499967 RepID=A0A081C4A9_VECG1|nr:polysaccharide biosynthesis protein [Candidatus Vecturithrix granuli]